MPPGPASWPRRSPTSTTASIWKKTWPLSLDPLLGGGSSLGAMTVSATQLLSIGRFARTTGLTIRTLRRYDAIGLLAPAHVDEDTGYRWYTLEQARALLHAPPETLREGLEAHRARLEGRAVELRHTLEELSRLIDGKEP